MLLSLGDIAITDSDFGPKFRARFGKQDGQPLPIQVERAGQRLTLNGKIRLVPRVESRLEADPGAPPKAAKVTVKALQRRHDRPVAAVRPACARCS